MTRADYPTPSGIDAVTCPTCKGDGVVRGTSRDCSTCEGSGTVHTDHAHDLRS